LYFPQLIIDVAFADEVTVLENGKFVDDGKVVRLEAFLLLQIFNVAKRCV
jgi:hypothetical protein